MTGERRGFSSNAFHQIAVGNDRVNVMIDERKTFFVELRGEMRGAHRHADAVRKALAERAGRDLNTGRQSVFGMAGRF